MNNNPKPQKPTVQEITQAADFLSEVTGHTQTSRQGHIQIQNAITLLASCALQHVASLGDNAKSNGKAKNVTRLREPETKDPQETNESRAGESQNSKPHAGPSA